MTSTTNKNSPGNYEAEQWYFLKQRAYENYHGRVVNNLTCLPGDGLLSGRYPSMVLSHNSTDIESELFGIGSTNLVHTKQITTPNFKKLKTLSIYDKPRIVIAEPLVIEKFQRPCYSSD